MEKFFHVFKKGYRGLGLFLIPYKDNFSYSGPNGRGNTIFKLCSNPLEDKTNLKTWVDFIPHRERSLCLRISEMFMITYVLSERWKMVLNQLKNCAMDVLKKVIICHLNNETDTGAMSRHQSAILDTENSPIWLYSIGTTPFQYRLYEDQGKVVEKRARGLTDKFR